jgi:hypothetical protein
MTDTPMARFERELDEYLSSVYASQAEAEEAEEEDNRYKTWDEVQDKKDHTLKHKAIYVLFKDKYSNEAELEWATEWFLGLVGRKYEKYWMGGSGKPLDEEIAEFLHQGREEVAPPDPLPLFMLYARGAIKVMDEREEHLCSEVTMPPKVTYERWMEAVNSLRH